MQAILLHIFGVIRRDAEAAMASELSDMSDLTGLLARVHQADQEAGEFLDYLRERMKLASPDSEEWCSLDFLVHHYSQLHTNTLRAIDHLQASRPEE